MHTWHILIGTSQICSLVIDLRSQQFYYYLSMETTYVWDGGLTSTRPVSKFGERKASKGSLVILTSPLLICQAARQCPPPD